MTRVCSLIPCGAYAFQRSTRVTDREGWQEYGWQGACYTLDALVEGVYTKVKHMCGAKIKLPEDLQPTTEWEIVGNHSSLYAGLRGERQSKNLWRLFEEALGDDRGGKRGRLAQAD